MNKEEKGVMFLSKKGFVKKIKSVVVFIGVAINRSKIRSLTAVCIIVIMLRDLVSVVIYIIIIICIRIGVIDFISKTIVVRIFIYFKSYFNSSITLWINNSVGFDVVWWSVSGCCFVVVVVGCITNVVFVIVFAVFISIVVTVIVSAFVMVIASVGIVFIVSVGVVVVSCCIVVIITVNIVSVLFPPSLRGLVM